MLISLKGISELLIAMNSLRFLILLNLFIFKKKFYSDMNVNLNQPESMPLDNYEVY